MTQLYLHIGYPKTGTTAIQEFLFLNREALIKQQILYPQTGIERYAHHQYPWVFAKDYRANEDLSMQILEEGLSKELNSHSGMKTVVVSSEGFVFLLQPCDISNIFGAMFDDIRIIVYLRQPFRWIQSDYNQGVKGWRRLKCSFDEHVNSVFSSNINPMDFYNKLSVWAKEFGWNNIILRTFDMEKRNLIEGFSNIIGARYQDDFVVPDRVDSNPRLSNTQLELVRVVNTFDMDKVKRDILLNDLLSDTIDSKNDNMGEEYSQLYCRINKGKLKKVDNSNRRLLRHFDKAYFEEDFFRSASSVACNSTFKQIELITLSQIVSPLLNRYIECMRNAV